MLTARRFHTQEANRADARERLAELPEEARQKPPQPGSRLSGVDKEQRLKGQKLRGSVRAGRGKVRFDGTLLRRFAGGVRRLRHRGCQGFRRRTARIEHGGGLVQRARFAHGHAARTGIVIGLAARSERQQACKKTAAFHSAVSIS
ncbi:MAG: hypothetical protein P8Y58_15135 [Novosphingobium sp.]